MSKHIIAHSINIQLNSGVKLEATDVQIHSSKPGACFKAAVSVIFLSNKCKITSIFQQ